MSSSQLDDLLLTGLTKTFEAPEVASSSSSHYMDISYKFVPESSTGLDLMQLQTETDEDDYASMTDLYGGDFKLPFETIIKRFYEGNEWKSFQLGDTKNIPFWSEAMSFTDESIIHNYEIKNFTMSPAIELATPFASWGPCYPPKVETEVLSWESTSPNVLKELFDKNNNMRATDYTSSVVRKQSDEDKDLAKFCANGKRGMTETLNDAYEGLHGMCLPGFLIIGAGKCGSSSLYRYLVQHPKVAPARQKQIGFFKYFLDKGLKCYLSFFPSTQEFISSGALITGEAFPGYLPYPNIASEVQRLLGSGGDSPRIIVSVREPLYRAYSSYKYNYLRMGLKNLREKDKNPQTDEYYKENFLLSFEELINAELEYLKECLEPGGKAEVLTFEKYGQRVMNFSNSSTPSNILVDVELCYAKTSSGNETSSPHEGYHLSKLMEIYPEKVTDIPQTNHLIRSMLARGIYILSIDWWYETFDKSDIHVVCLEELSQSQIAMDNVTRFLGLPTYDFSSIITKERYNVGGNEGFTSLTRTEGTSTATKSASIPLSDKLRYEVQGFFSFYNERLFERMGRRCSWG